MLKLARKVKVHSRQLAYTGIAECDQHGVRNLEDHFMEPISKVKDDFYESMSKKSCKAIEHIFSKRD